MRRRRRRRRREETELCSDAETVFYSVCGFKLRASS